MQPMAILESLFRWTHVVAGILWIGLLYFFNFVNSAFVPTLDADAKKKVVPELMPRALYWFRWGAAWTWAMGVLLLLLVFYHGGAAFEGTPEWTASAIVMMLVPYVAPFIYDAVMKGLGKSNMKAAIALCFVLAAAYVYLMANVAGFSYRGMVIHLGAAFGTIMAFNVWYRIWPSQRQIIAATKGGTAPDAALVSLAGTRSRHNTYMSVPLVWTMINQHTTWASNPTWGWILLMALVLLGWWITSMLYKRAPKVKGF
jgi:uncharacterized membrane protein